MKKKIIEQPKPSSYTYSEMAKELGISKSLVAHYIWNLDIKAYRIPGVSKRFVSVSDFECIKDYRAKNMRYKNK